MTMRSVQNGLCVALCLSAAVAWVGCVGWSHDPDAYQTRVTSPERAVALSGEALAQKKWRLGRLQRDLVHIRDTVMSLRRHRNGRGRKQLDTFALAFVDRHVKPLLGKRETNRNAELLPLDANLLLAEADLWLELRRHSRLAQALREIDRRFHGHEDMPVDYPHGERSTLAQALQQLKRLRKTI